MRLRADILLLAASCAQPVLAQTFRWEATIPPVTAPGLYRIVLSPEFVGCSLNDLGDVRLLDSTGTEVPYILEIATRYKTRDEFHHFEISRNEAVGEWTFLELKRPYAGVLVDHISLRLRNAEVVKEVEITGSDDGRTWYVIKNDQLRLVHGIHLAHVTQEIRLPPTDYRHYRIALNDSLTAPVHVLGAQWFSQARSYGEYTAAQGVGWSQQDSAGTTRIHVPRSFAHPIDRILFTVSDTQSYRRSGSMVTRRTSETGSGRKKRTWSSDATLATFMFSSEDGPVVDLDGPRATAFDLVFQNGDDQPLHFTDVRFMQLERTIIANLQPGMQYTLATGDPLKNAPRYDMGHFQQELPDPLGKLVHGMVQLRPVLPETRALFDPSRWWVWGGIIILILGIGIMAFRMLRADQPPTT